MPPAKRRGKERVRSPRAAREKAGKDKEQKPKERRSRRDAFGGAFFPFWTILLLVARRQNVLCVLLVWSFFLSLVLTRAFFLYAPLRARRHELGTAALDPSVRFIQVQPVGELDFSAGEARVDAVPSDNGEAFAQV